MELNMEAMLGLCVGISLAAACGFRIFVPLLVMSLAAMTGHLELADGFGWIGSPVAVFAFGTATLAEILAYYIPAVDNALDTAATPIAIIAGTVVTAAATGEMSPFLRWSLAAVAGGGAAATVQGLTSLTRLASTATTAGLGNPIVSTAEAGAATVLATFGIWLPALAAVIVVMLVFVTLRMAYRYFKNRRAGVDVGGTPSLDTENHIYESSNPAREAAIK